MPRARLGILASAILVLSACPNTQLAALNPCTVSSASIRVDTGGVSDVDLLFVLDNSSSMATEQEKLALQLPQLVDVLVSGDRYKGRTPPEGIADKDRFFTPVRSLHLGVVSSSMGGADDEILSLGDSAALRDCIGLGDDGVLLRSVDIAIDGVINTPSDLGPEYKPGQEVLAPLPGCDIVGDQPPYQSYVEGDGTTAEELAQNFSCVSRLGVRGCPFEQQLEAMWKAVAPSNGKDPNLHVFLNGTKGHGDPSGDNEGFVRPDAILALIQVSDEEDCSVTDQGKGLLSGSEEAAAEYGENLNLRCGDFAEVDGILWTADRYVRGLRSLKPDNEDLVVFGAIVGIPEDAIGQDFDEVLARDEMQFGNDGKGFPTTSCVSSKGDKAYPPRRFLEVAKGFGDDAVVYSICADSFAPALDRLIERIASKLSGNCLPQPLVRDEDGQVRCDVFEILPPGMQKCDPEHGHDGKPFAREVTENNKKSERTVCHMQQVPVIAGTADDKVGWYYDDFDPKLKDECKSDPQRISFSFGSLPNGGGAFIECFRPVPRIESNAVGMDAVNIGCEGNAAICAERSEDQYALFCTPDNTCQIECEKNPECPPGWVCGTKAGEGDGPKYCQIPTCPSDDK